MKIFLLTIFLVLMTNSSFASMCPVLWAKVDTRMDEINDEKIKLKVKKLRNDGEMAHFNGDHAKSEELLNKALGLIKN